MENESKIDYSYFDDIEINFLTGTKTEEELNKEIENLIIERNKNFLENGLDIPNMKK